MGQQGLAYCSASFQPLFIPLASPSVQEKEKRNLMIEHETMSDTVSDTMSDAIYVEAGLGLVNQTA